MTRLIDRDNNGWPCLKSMVENGVTTEDIRLAGEFLARFKNDADAACDIIRAASELGEITNQKPEDYE